MKTTTAKTTTVIANVPQISLHCPKGTNQRVVNAELHKLAAEIELATPEDERWLVRVDTQNNRVYLELFIASRDEIECGLTILRKVVG